MSGTSGPTSGRQFAFYDRDTSSWRMWPDTGLWGSIEFSETWPKTGYMHGGRAFELPTLVPRTTGSVCSSSPRLPTPIAADGDRERNNPAQARRKSPPLSAVGHMLPTPTSSDYKRDTSAAADMARKSPSLTTVESHFPTPMASDATGGGTHPSRRAGRTAQLIDTVLSIGDDTGPLFDVGSC